MKNMTLTRVIKVHVNARNDFSQCRDHTLQKCFILNLPRLFFSLGGGAGIGPIMSSSSSSSLFSAASKPRFLLPSSAILKLQRNLTGQRRMRFKYAQAQIDAPLGNLSIYTPPSTDGNQ